MASKRHQRRRECGHKQRHTDRTGAVAHLIQLQKADRVRGAFGSLRTYKCRHCKGWHVGHYQKGAAVER